MFRVGEEGLLYLKRSWEGRGIGSRFATFRVPPSPLGLSLSLHHALHASASSAVA